MEGLESQPQKIKPQNLEESPFYGIKSEDSLEQTEQTEEVEDVTELPFLTMEGLRKVFSLNSLKEKYIEQLSYSELTDFMQRIHDFEKKIKDKAESGELKYGDNVISPEDLNKFVLYNILIGRNITPEAAWLDFEGDVVERFMSNGFRETESA